MGEKITKHRLHAATGSAALAAALALTACGGDDEDADPGSRYGAPETDTETPTDAATTEDDAGGAGSTVDELGLAETDLGEVVVDGEEMTVYLFTEDAGGTPTCYEQCAENWPPLLAEDDGEVEVGDGLDESLVGRVEREDGSMQVTYNEHPLYFWVDDAAPGDINGQGVNNVWYVLDAEGNAITEMP
ncbi:hypothetical protein GCM10027447_28920 [Glycomyces halotolerans]